MGWMSICLFQISNGASTPLFTTYSGLCSTFDNNDFENCNLDPQFNMESLSWVDTQLCYELRHY